MEEIKQKKRSWEQINIKERAALMMERLKEPDITEAAFSKKHNVTPALVKRLQELINFDGQNALSDLMGRVLKKDNELIDLASDINIKFANQVGAKRTIAPKDVETLDKISNTAMKRAALIKATQDGDDDKGIEVVINF